MADAPSSSDVASTVGTWIAAGLAIVALVGIVGPYLLLRASHSERSQALNAVNDAKTGYVTYWLTENIGPRHVKAPILDQPPAGNDLSNAFKPQLELPKSSTGWVSFAFLGHCYAPTAKRGDHLHIRQREAWFPIHRLYILAIGLRGRYGHRKDRGESRAVDTRSRIFTEGDIDRDTSYRRSSTAEVLYGLTGTLWWRQTLDGQERRLDELYFAPHRDTITVAQLDDSALLRELFWLSIGCLPLTYGGKERFFDLDREPDDVHRTWKPEHRFDTEYKCFKFSKREVSPRHMQWTDAFGIRSKDAKRVYSLKHMAYPGPGIEEPRTRRVHKGRLLQNDVDKIALAVMQLHPSRRGFFRFQHRHIYKFLPTHLANWKFQLCRTRAIDWLGRVVPGARRQRRDELAKSLDNLVSLPEIRLDFSRERAERCYNLDQMIAAALGKRWKWLQCIAVLVISDEGFFHWVEERRLGKDRPTLGITVKFQRDRVRIRHRDYLISVSELFHDCADRTIEVSTGDILLTAIRAWTRLVMLDNTIDSQQLLNMVNDMTDICLVSPSTCAPDLLMSDSELSV